MRCSTEPQRKDPVFGMHRPSSGGFIRTGFAAAFILFLQPAAHAIETMECGGTEPFWDAKLSDTRVTFTLPGERKITYSSPRYRAPRGASMEGVMSVRASRGKSTLVGFVVNEERMTVADKNGKSPPDEDVYRAYCADGMSERGWPYSIHLIVDGTAYTGCCSTATSPPIGSD